MLKRIGTSLLMLLVFAQSYAQKDTTEQKAKWTPSALTHQQKLSRTSIMMQFLGSAIAPSLAAEYSMIKRERFSFDLRGAAWAYPFGWTKSFSFSLGPQIQYGKRVGRLIAGIGVGTAFNYGKEFIGQGSLSKPRIQNEQYHAYFMLGYRAQHKHGFFFEIDALMFAPGFFGVPDIWPVSPWAGLVFGYRIPSKLMRSQWKTDGLITKEERSRRRDSEKQAKLIGRQNSDPRIRSHSRLYVEGLGVAPWTLNYEYTVSLNRSGIPAFSVRTGVGYTSSLSIPIGIGIGAIKNGHGGFLVGGINILYDNGARLSSYFGVNFQIHVGKGISLGFAGYGLVNPYWGNESFFTGNRGGLAPMAGINIGYRLK